MGTEPSSPDPKGWTLETCHCMEIKIYFLLGQVLVPPDIDKLWKHEPQQPGAQYRGLQTLVHCLCWFGMVNAAWEHAGGEPGKGLHKQSPKVSRTSARMKGITSRTWQQDRILLSPHSDPQWPGEPVGSSSVLHKADLLCRGGSGDMQQQGCDSRTSMHALYFCSSCSSFLLQQLPPLSAQPRPPQCYSPESEKCWRFNQALFFPTRPKCCFSPKSATCWWAACKRLLPHLHRTERKQMREARKEGL